MATLSMFFPYYVNKAIFLPQISGASCVNSLSNGTTNTSYCGADIGISASLANASAAMFQLPTLKHVETCVDMMTDAKHFILCS